MTARFFTLAAFLIAITAGQSAFATKHMKRKVSNVPNAKIYACSDDFGFLIDGKTAVVSADGADSGTMNWKDDSNDSIKVYTNKKATLTVDFIILTGSNEGTVRYKQKGQSETTHEGCKLSGSQG